MQPQEVRQWTKFISFLISWASPASSAMKSFAKGKGLQKLAPKHESVATL